MSSSVYVQKHGFGVQKALVILPSEPDLLPACSAHCVLFPSTVILCLMGKKSNCLDCSILCCHCLEAGAAAHQLLPELGKQMKFPTMSAAKRCQEKIYVSQLAAKASKYKILLPLMGKKTNIASVLPFSFIVCGFNKRQATGGEGQSLHMQTQLPAYLPVKELIPLNPSPAAAPRHPTTR